MLSKKLTDELRLLLGRHERKFALNSLIQSFVALASRTLKTFNSLL
jgi:hypothetical protein